MFYVIHGDFYEAYALYKDEIQSVRCECCRADTAAQSRPLGRFGAVRGERVFIMTWW